MINHFADFLVQEFENISENCAFDIKFFSEYDQPHESQTNKDIVETIHRKGMGGPDSPEADEGYHIGDESSPR